MQVITFLTPYSPAPCAKKYRSEHQTLFPRFGRVWARDYGKGGKERLVTIDRFPWHGGIQERDVISNVTRKEVSALPFFEASTSVIWLRVVRAVRLQL